MDLVIMAGGLGSRFGGLKQFEPIDKNKNFLVDYTIFDAVRCGFKNVIFVINKNNFELFKNTVGKRASTKINVEYCFQENEFPELRQKPLGTAHAVLSAKSKITDNFVVVNADDFYGYESMKLANTSGETLSSNEFSMIAFKAKNTISKFGSVKRGVCSVSDDGFLEKIEECKLSLVDDKIFATPLTNDSNTHEIPSDSFVSMNLWAFPKSFLNNLEEEYAEFCKDENNLRNNEIFLPKVVESAIEKNNCKVNVKLTPSEWFGLTYKEDKAELSKNIEKLIENKKYPKNLWNNEN